VQKNGGESSSGLHRSSQGRPIVATFMPDNNKKMLTTFSPDFVNHQGQLGAVIWTLKAFFVPRGNTFSKL
jgi:hypothetical protein